MNTQSSKSWIVIAGFGLLILIFIAALTGANKAIDSDDGSINVTIASSSTKKEWLDDSVQRFNAASHADRALKVDGTPVRIKVVLEELEPGKFDHYRSGTMVTDIEKGRIKPVIASPAEASWLAKLNSDWKLDHGSLISTGAATPLLRTPLVIAMWESRARAMGCWPVATNDCTWSQLDQLAESANGWGMLGHPEWGKLKFGYGYVGESNSGTLTAAMLCMVGAGKIAGLELTDVSEDGPCGKMIAGVEHAKVHSGKKSDWLLGWMETGGPEYLDAVTSYEQEVIDFNRRSAGRLREPLVAAYPKDGTVVVEHPFAILDGADWVSPEQVRGAELFRAYLLGDERQAALAQTGLRPADPAKKPSPPIEAANGVNPDAFLLPAVLPDVLVMERITEVWHKNKKHAVLVLVFDKSGSMQGPKLTTALAGAKTFIDSMDPEDYFLWIPFDDKVFTGVEGTKAAIGERLLGDISSTTAGGGTALYDSISRAYEALQTKRKTLGDSVRYGIVVLSDGVDTSSKTGRAGLQAMLTPGEGDPTAIQIHTIGIGDDADKSILTQIATSAHGRYWDAKNPERVIDAYRQIAVHY